MKPTPPVRRRLFGMALAATLSATTGLSMASTSDFPKGPVRIIVPVAAGGGLDAVARVLAPPLSKRWNQPVIVDNRPGVGGMIGASAAAKSPPDGLTLLIAHDAVTVANRFLYKSLPYSPENDLAPVAMVVQANQLVLATPNTHAKDLKELVEHTKRAPGKLAFASFGPGSPPHLAFAMLNSREGLDLLDVPYKGIAPSLQALLGGEVNLSLGSAAIAGKLIEAGKLKVLAVTDNKRDPTYPDVKTAQEQGFGYLQISIWHSLFAPAGTPPELLHRIAADVRAVTADPEFMRRLPGFTLLDGGPKELAERIRVETARMKEMSDAAKLRPE